MGFFCTTRVGSANTRWPAGGCGLEAGLKRDLLVDVVGLALEALGHHLIELGVAAAALGAAAAFRALGLFQG